MPRTQTLTRHRDIQNWVKSRHGHPAVTGIRDSLGQARARLRLAFRTGERRERMALPNQDDGLSPISWQAWLAEFDRQNLALRVNDDLDGSPEKAFEFIRREN